MKPVIILVKPQMGENIGAAARAMLNFGLEELRLVAPRDNWPNPQAESVAAGANNVIHSAKIFDTLQEAVSDINIIYATSARKRYMNKPILSVKEFAKDIHSYNSKTAIIFGPEKSGLDNESVTYANKIITIPVNPEFSSLNLAQSVAVVAYEYFSYDNINSSTFESKLASQKEISSFFEFLEDQLDYKGFFQVTEKKASMVNNIRNIFRRIENFSTQDVRTLYGIAKALTRK
ncbi:MAG: RNA methyltransferase [Alphaproteobacteria bacterium]